jgi:hypothetical protein
MSFGGSVAAMISSLKANDRRRIKRSIYDKNKNQLRKGNPINTKKLTTQGKEKLLLKLKENREVENKKIVYKLITSLCITIIVIGGIVFAIKITFF